MDNDLERGDRERVNGQSSSVAREVPDDALLREMDGLEVYTPPRHAEGIVGWTMFDTPTAQDDTVVALLPKDKIGKVPNRGLVRIESEGDGRTYLGIVQAGPFAEPDGLRGDAPLVVTVQVRSGQMLLPQFHGRIHIELMGQKSGKAVTPPRFRPLPSSPVFLLDAGETRELLRCEGDMALGLAVGHDDLKVGIPSGRKSVMPRHTGVLGTTGAGKSTTVSRMIQQAQKAGMAVILLDVEGEYTEMGRPADNPEMVELLAERGIAAKGVSDTALYHLVGTETTNLRHPNRREFSPPFSRLSPYMVCEILDLTDAQQTRYWQAYENCKALLRELGIYPQRVMGRVEESHERRLERLDEFAEGYPGMTLGALLDVVSAFLHTVERQEDSPRLYSTEFRDSADRVMRRVKQSKAESAVSWRALRARLFRLMRLNVFDSRKPGVHSIDYDELARPGAVSVIDLSDMEAADLRNLVIADIIRGVERAQEKAFDAAARSGAEVPRTLVVVEEAHEFLSVERVRRMPNLFQTVSRIAKRGRKRWLGLVFITQHPQHLPDELLGLLNNYVLHRINDANTIGRLRRSIGGIDAGLWERVTSLAPGQAVVSFTHLSRAMLVTVDPTQCRLRMAEE
ncbi:MAG: ATP-binding protein [Chloroflexi bacterium]|nr:ATP-binding protein [Chloroflexota bacterium]